MPWEPGSRRAQRALESPFEDVPDHLYGRLWQWIEDVYENASRSYMSDGKPLVPLLLQLRIPVPAGLTHNGHVKILRIACQTDPTLLLDVIEATVGHGGVVAFDGSDTEMLDAILKLGNSAYKVNSTSNGLERRVAAGVQQAIAETVSVATGSAGDHLTNAWNEAYGLHADPVKAYSEAIKSVEAALAPLVSPQNGRQTLGTMVRDVSAKTAKWVFPLGDATDGGVVLSMMKALWDGQTSRHGGLNPTRSETADEARAAVHLAATLVQFGTSGAFRSVSGVKTT